MTTLRPSRALKALSDLLSTTWGVITVLVIFSAVAGITTFLVLTNAH